MAGASPEAPWRGNSVSHASQPSYYPVACDSVAVAADDRVCERVEIGAINAEEPEKRVPANATVTTLDLGDELGTQADPLSGRGLCQLCREAQFAQSTPQSKVVSSVGEFRRRHDQKGGPAGRRSYRRARPRSVGFGAADRIGQIVEVRVIRAQHQQQRVPARAAVAALKL